MRWKPPNSNDSLSRHAYKTFSINYWLSRLQTIMDVKVLLDGLDSFRFSCAVFLRQKLVQLGDDVAPNMWTCVWWSFDSFVKSLFGHHRKLSTSRSFGLTKTWWNIASILATTAIGSFLKRMRTPTRLYVKSGPWSNWSFSEVPLNLAVQSKTTGIFSGLWGLETAWCIEYTKLVYRLDLVHHQELFWRSLLSCTLSLLPHTWHKAGHS